MMCRALELIDEILVTLRKDDDDFNAISSKPDVVRSAPGMGGQGREKRV